MKILFALDHHYFPQFAGGAQSSSHEMAQELIRQGHEVSVASLLVPDDWLGLTTRLRLRLSGGRPFSDRKAGYPVYRLWNVRAGLAEVARQSRPDVALVQIGEIPLAAALRESGVPTLVYLRDVEMDRLGADPRILSGVRFVANSQFVSDRFKETFGIGSDVVPPLFMAERYKVDTRRTNVTLINPHPYKGVDIALEIARQCPDIPFSFVESWVLEPAVKADLDSQLKALPNVKWRPRTPDMKSVYEQAKIVLMPSRWEEAWGRVASEAHYSGIPVVASTRGGIPESVGPGGVLLDPDGPIEPWVEAVRRLWSDPAYYAELSAAALSYSTRPQINSAGQAEALLGLMNAAIEAAKSPTAA